MKKMITALFAILTIMMFSSTTAFAAEAENCIDIDEIMEIQLVEFSPYYVDGESDDPLFYRIQKQQQAMADESEKTFNPYDYTKKLLKDGAKVKATIDESAGKHYVNIKVYVESNSQECETVKWFSADGVEFTVIGQSISWRIELPF